MTRKSGPNARITYAIAAMIMKTSMTMGAVTAMLRSGVEDVESRLVELESQGPLRVNRRGWNCLGVLSKGRAMRACVEVVGAMAVESTGAYSQQVAQETTLRWRKQQLKYVQRRSIVYVQEVFSLGARSSLGHGLRQDNT